MRVFRSLQEIRPIGERRERSRAVAIGTFDGVHLGHRRIVSMAAESAEAMDGIATVVTFEPHPLTVLHRERAPALLTPLEQKIHILETIGVDETVVIPFDEDFARLSPAEFCRLLLSEKLQARQVMVGQNFRFGNMGAGTPADLLSYGLEYGFAVTVIEMLELEGEPVSSTRIRRLIGEGAVEKATRLLGRPYSVRAPVVAGAGRGRDLDVPTANIAPRPEVVVPSEGVYITRTDIGTGDVLPSVTSVGTNPTFEEGGPVRIESHILDFAGGLYGREIGVEFLRLVRGQKTFSGPEELVAQIRKDIREARSYFRAEDFREEMPPR